MKLGNEEIVIFLKEAALLFHRVAHRCSEYLASLSKKAEAIYHKVISLLPVGSSLQLELLGQGDYRKEFDLRPLVLSNIAKLLQQNPTVCITRKENKSARKSLEGLGSNKYIPLQLALDLESVTPS